MKYVYRSASVSSWCLKESLEKRLESWQKKEPFFICFSRACKLQAEIFEERKWQTGWNGAEALVPYDSKHPAVLPREQVLTPFNLYTCLLEVAKLVNQHPIGRVPNDSDDRSYLCRNNMLLRQALSTVPQGPFQKTNNPNQGQSSYRKSLRPSGDAKPEKRSCLWFRESNGMWKNVMWE